MSLLAPRTPTRGRLQAGSVPFVYPYTVGQRSSKASGAAYGILRPDAFATRCFPRPQPTSFTKGWNLVKFLCKADIKSGTVAARQGCAPCGEPNCTLDSHIVSCSTVTSARTGRTFPVQGNLTCKSANVIYVFECTKCRAQGVGETACASIRLQAYLRAALADGTGTRPTCAIEQHFFVADHGPNDLKIMLVDAVPHSFKFQRSVYRSIRVRLEQRWIQTLDAQLNVRKQWHFSFAGGFGSQDDQDEEELKKPQNI